MDVKNGAQNTVISLVESSGGLDNHIFDTLEWFSTKDTLVSIVVELIVSFFYIWHRRRWSKLLLRRKRSSTFVWNVIKYLIEFNGFKLIKPSQHMVQTVHDANTSSELVLNCCNTRRILSTMTAPPVIWNFVILEITTNINEMFITWIQTDAPPALKNSQPVNV